MEIAQITRALQHDVVTIVFLNVLLQQIGLPVPAAPTLLLAGSLAATLDLLLSTARDWPKDRPVVTLCACPEDASAKQAAIQPLMSIQADSFK